MIRLRVLSILPLFLVAALSTASAKTYLKVGILDTLAGRADAIVAVEILSTNYTRTAADGPMYAEARVLKALKGNISLRRRIRFGETGWWGPTFREGERRIIFLSRVTSKDPYYEVEWHTTYTGGVDFFLDKGSLPDLSEASLKDFLDTLEEVRLSPPTIRFGVDVQDTKPSRLSLTITNETDPALWINPSRIVLSLNIDGIRYSRRVDWAIPFESPWIRIEPGSTLSGSVGIEPQQLKGVGEFTVMMGHSVAFFPHRCWVGTKVVKIRTDQEEDIQEAVFRHSAPDVGLFKVPEMF